MSRAGYVISCSIHASEWPDGLDGPRPENDAVSVLDVLVAPGTLASPPEFARLRVADGGDLRVGDWIHWSDGEVWRFYDTADGLVKRIYMRLAGRPAPEHEEER